MIVAAVLVAGGSGERLGANLPKAFVRVGGRTLLEHALERFSAHHRVRDIVVVTPIDHLFPARDRFGPSDRSEAGKTRSTSVAGGPTRQLSVAAGLGALADDITHVLVHDVARPFVPHEVIDRVVDALAEGAEAVIPVVPVTDTVRRVAVGGAIGEPVDRATLVAVQTPQGFDRDVLVHAHAAAASGDTTDDATLVEALGVPVSAVRGSDLSFKITTPGDLSRAEAVVGRG